MLERVRAGVGAAPYAHRRVLVQPESIIGGEMRDYQLASLDWLVERHERRLSAILGDEMGLGKTLQTIAFLAHLKFERKLPGAFLVLCPLSVLGTWTASSRAGARACASSSSTRATRPSASGSRRACSTASARTMSS